MNQTSIHRHSAGSSSCAIALACIIHSIRYESSRWLCISAGTAMTMQDVVNPTSKEDERALRLGAVSWRSQ